MRKEEIEKEAMLRFIPHRIDIIPNDKDVIAWYAIIDIKPFKF